jgi:hypothetical protein
METEYYEFQISEQDHTFNMGVNDASATFTLGDSVQVYTNTDYNKLTNKPKIEGITLEGNKEYEELNLEHISNQEIEVLFGNL